MTAAEFKAQLLTRDAGDIVEEIILADHPGPFTTTVALTSIEELARATFGISADQPVKAIVVGSAKLGFSFIEKPPRDGRGYKPAYRAYRPGDSDIDIAIVSPQLYGQLWQALALFGTNQQYFPWRTDLAPYMLHGWIRPDKFPRAAPMRCNEWKEMINKLSRSEHFRYTKLKCALYNSRYFLKIYQQRGVVAAQQAEKVA